MASTPTWNTYFNTNAGITDRLWQQDTFARLTRNVTGLRALQIGFTDTETLTSTPIAMRVLACDCVRFVDHDTRLPVLCDDAQLPFLDESFDLITWPHGIDIADSPIETLSEISRVLAPNGLLLTTFFNKTGSWKMMSRFARSCYFPQGVCGQTVSDVKSLIADAGLTYTGGCYGVYAVNANPGNGKKLPLDLAGDRWWPTLGNLVMLSARKMTQTATLVGHVNFSRNPASVRALLAGETQKTKDSL